MTTSGPTTAQPSRSQVVTGTQDQSKSNGKRPSIAASLDLTSNGSSRPIASRTKLLDQLVSAKGVTRVPSRRRMRVAGVDSTVRTRQPLAPVLKSRQGNSVMHRRPKLMKGLATPRETDNYVSSVVPYPPRLSQRSKLFGKTGASQRPFEFQKSTRLQELVDLPLIISFDEAA